MGVAEPDKFAIAEDDGEGPIQAFLSATARELDLWIVGGTIPLRVPGQSRLAAAALVFDAQGRRCFALRQDPPVRRRGAGQGRAIPGVRYDAARHAASLRGYAGRPPRAGCLLRHPLPGAVPAASAMGAEWFCLPSAFTAPTGRAHWETLLRARAIENLCHLVAPAQSGLHENGRETHGDSMIVDCWGRVVGRLPHGTGVVIGDIDLVRQRDVRQNFPSVDHRRLES